MVFFLGLFFVAVILKRFVFGVSGIVSKLLKMLVFPSFGGFFWGGSLLFIWVWKVQVFLCFLCLFFFFALLVFLFVCFVLGFVVGCCCFVFVFVVFFCFVFLVFLEGLSVR